MITPVIIKGQEHLINKSLTIVSIADMHIGSTDAQYTYDLLIKQFVQPLYNINFDILVIAGDTFHKKELANSQNVMMALLVIDEIVNLVRFKNASLIIEAGTEDHDAGQLRLFYKYLNDTSVDVRIVEQARFEYVKGIRILCLPEEYNKPQEYYDEFLFNSGLYDIAIVHGMYKGAVYQEQVITADNINPRNYLFNMDDFCNCMGYVIAGHVHKPGCFDKYFYYCGSPYTWKYGEEYEKGFMISLYNPNTHQHYLEMQPIISRKYVTVNLDDLISKDPSELIYYVNLLLDDIEYLRLEFLKSLSDVELTNLSTIRKYYQNNNRIKIKVSNKKKEKILEKVQTQNDELAKYAFLLGNGTIYDKFAQYVNLQEGTEYTNAQEIMEILEEN